MTAPVPVPPGRRLGVFTPSSPGDPDSLPASIAILERLGYVVPGPPPLPPWERRHYLASSDGERAA